MKPLATLVTVLAVSCFQLSLGETEKEQKLIEANNEFAIRLLKVLPSPPNDNVFFSPHSLSTALGMAFIGARGSTLQELAEVLGYSAVSLNESDIQEAFSQQNSRLQAHAQQAGLEVANSAAVQEGFEVLDSYYNTLNRTFNAHVFNVDFAHNSQQAVDTINEWVKQATHNKIDKLFYEPLDTDTRLVLMNAILFKGFWEREFEPRHTAKHVFYNGGIQSTQVDTMFLRHTTKRGFSEPLQSKVLELNYRDSDYSMVIVLPEERDGMEAVKQVLTMEKLNAAIASLSKLPVAISLPNAGVADCEEDPMAEADSDLVTLAEAVGCLENLRDSVSQQQAVPEEVHNNIDPLDRFKLDKLNPLKSNLTHLGLQRIFGDADLSGITGNRQLVVSDVLQRAVVDVNEEGTEAAAVSGVVTVNRIGSEPFRFTADHPFMFFIRDRKTNEIFFAGQVNNL